MEVRFACKNLGVNCRYSVKGNSVHDVLRKVEKHAREDHGLTEEDFKNPDIINELRTAIHVE